MKWSWRIGRLAGIGIYVHVTFVLLPLWIGFTHFSTRHRWTDAGTAVAFILILFGIVVLHELGHALAARRFGIETRDITLLPIGGVARLERMPDQPKQELLVALAGPAVNVALALLLFAILGAGEYIAKMARVELAGGEFLGDLMWVNVALAVFNMVPAFPMDGGRVLRALLALRLTYARATSLAARVGQGIAFVFAFIGLASMLFGGLGPISNPFLVLIAAFVWIGAAQEAGLVQIKSTLGEIPVSRVMITEFRTLVPQDPLWHAVELSLGSWQHDFPVMESGRLAGLLTRSALAEGLARRGEQASVGEFMTRRFPTINPNETADRALLRLRSGEGEILLATRAEELVGLVTRENLTRYLVLDTSLKRGQGTRAGARLLEKQVS